MRLFTSATTSPLILIILKASFPSIFTNENLSNPTLISQIDSFLFRDPDLYNFLTRKLGFILLSDSIHRYPSHPRRNENFCRNLTKSMNNRTELNDLTSKSGEQNSQKPPNFFLCGVPFF